ncbi:hypothetical protein WJX72_005664 [[Myrmecia] bisecta]|uniref:COX assembly mitochondrial protein n=1 Tax=[Myrmecia] bisecta TaxID=41462 RepID=A0AAW1PHI7_9CHLO
MKQPEQQLSRKVEEALLYKLKQHAMKSCAHYAKAYAECCSGRVMSMVWACRGELADLNGCLHKHTKDEVLSEVKRRWMEAGQPEVPDWEGLLRGL